jgi:phospholipid/cholesterol/gamma-HCH transport system substrate-binding protein
MENRSHAIVAVGFLLVFIVGAIGLYSWLSNQHAEPLPYEIITSQSVGGLSAQSEVHFKGLVVGHVTDIGFDPHDRSHVIIHFKLRPHTYVTHATYAVVAKQGLTGGSALELKLGHGSRAPLATSQAHPARIPLHPSLLASLENSAKQDMQDVHDVLGSAKKLLNQTNRKHLAATIAQLDTATGKLAAIETRLEPTLQQLPALVKNLNRSVTDADQLVRTAKMPVQNAVQLEASIGAMAKSTRQLTQSLNRQTVPQVGVLSRKLQKTSGQLDQLLRELQAKPQSLIFGPPQRPPGPGEPGFGAGNKQGKRP